MLAALLACAVVKSAPLEIRTPSPARGCFPVAGWLPRCLRGDADPVLDQISPIKHIDAVTVPVLLIHGKDDTVVSFEQSAVMFDALRRADEDVEFVVLKHEEHWLSHSETRLQMLQTCVAFLRAHNPRDRKS